MPAQARRHGCCAAPATAQQARSPWPVRQSPATMPWPNCRADHDARAGAVNLRVVAEARFLTHQVGSFDQQIGRGEGYAVAAARVDGEETDVGQVGLHRLDRFQGGVDDRQLQRHRAPGWQHDRTSTVRRRRDTRFRCTPKAAMGFQGNVPEEGPLAGFLEPSQFWPEAGTGGWPVWSNSTDELHRVAKPRHASMRSARPPCLDPPRWPTRSTDEA